MIDLQTWFPLIAVLSLAAATLFSEDLTCVGAGVLVAEGALSFPVAIVGCFVGIVGGDVLLMLGGRWFGRAGLRTALMRRVVTEEALERSARWMQKRGAVVVALSRFVPGTRLATYITAGVLGMGVGRFAAYASLTAALWVPALVAASAFAGRPLVSSGLTAAGTWAVRAGLCAVALYLVVRFVSRQLLWRMGRRFRGLWCRWTRWEFWPTWTLYAPLVPYFLGLAMKHRSLTVFTAANPDMPAGGFVDESKFDILRGLAGSGERIAPSVLVPAEASLVRRAGIVRGFMDRASLVYPIVLKPDRGERGAGVAIVRSESDLMERLAALPVDAIAQKYVPGVEFGVFYYRRPTKSRGHIFSITHKRFPAVTGDGRSTIQSLILADERAVCLAPLHMRVHRAKLARIPANGEIVTLVETGSHCRGALFVDACDLRTPALERAFDDVAQCFGGFYFGRFDVRAASIEALTVRGEFTVLELNGVTSEATHIYDPRHGFFNALRVLASQWRLAFEIGAENRRRGVKPATAVELLRLVLKHRRRHFMPDGSDDMNAQVMA